MSVKESLADYIRHVPNFPVPGVEYQDITPLLRTPAAFQEAIDAFTAHYEGRHIDAVIGIESRGFIFAAPLAYRLGASMIPVRKYGRLPAATYEIEYYLQFGSDKLQLHRDALAEGARVVVFDDLLASGRTIAAACELVGLAGAKVEEVACLVELKKANGRARLENYPVFSLIQL
ncbi:MAG: adenine phosphoribosyltransferase [Kouleothrix sp.]|nr:adenine phosphoribosyltransferase [Kouleothrix sp.]